MKYKYSKSKIPGLVKSNLLFFLMLIILLWTLSPAVSLLLPDDYAEFNVVTAVFGESSNNLKLSSVPISYFFSQYGSITFLNMLVYKIFEFNSIYYYILNIFLRILASSSIYYFTAKWCKSKFAGFIAGIYFGVSFPGIQNTTRVTLYITYLAVFFMFIFLDKWFQFHSVPNIKNARLSIISLIFSILIFPVRMAGTAIILFAGEVYWLISKGSDYKNLRLRLKHAVIAFISLIILTQISGTLKQTEELQFKMVSLIILLRTVLTGTSPSIFSIWLFISNLILSPIFFTYKLISSVAFDNLSVFLPIFSSVVFFILLFKKKYLLALMSTTAILYSFLVNISTFHLINWQKTWVISTKYGGALFLLSFITLLYMYGKKKMNAQVGFLGISLLISNVLFAWMLAPVYFNDSQSAFDFAIRYYTLPSAGMALILASLSSFLIEAFKDSLSKLKIKNFLVPPAILFPLGIITLVLLWNSISTHKSLTQLGTNINARKVDNLWNLLKKEVNPSGDSLKLVYIENFGSQEEIAYIKSIFPIRFSIIMGKINKLPQVTFVFDKQEVSSRLSNKNPNPIAPADFYTYKFGEGKLENIHDEFFVNP